MELAQNEPPNTMGPECLQPLTKKVVVNGQLDPRKLPNMNDRPVNSNVNYFDAQRAALEWEQHWQDTLDVFAPVASNDVWVHR